MRELFKLIDGIIRDGYAQAEYLGMGSEDGEMYLDDAIEEARHEIYMAYWSGKYSDNDLKKLEEFFKIYA